MRAALIALLLLFAAAPAYAQYGVPGAEGALSLSLSPQHPAPGQAVTLSLSSPLYDLENSAITWSANGTTIAQGVGVTSATLSAGALGEATDIAVEVDSPSGSASTELSITPAALDLLWESTSYTPPFYLGRALPSSGARITLVALPRFGEGHSVSPSSLIYTWRQDGRVLSKSSGRGKSSVTLDGPLLYGSTLITVDAVTADGSLSAQASTRISDTAPSLVLYENHPLYGILYHRALGSAASLADTEASFVAIPYFAPAVSARDSSLVYDWTVNRTTVASDGAHPNEITLNAANSSGIADIRLTLSHRANAFFGLAGDWTVTLHAGDASEAGIADPFGGAQ